jgi:serpin B
LTGARFIDTLNNKQDILVNVSMPKFEYEYSIDMIDALIALGIYDAFDAGMADFSRMATSSNGNIYISKVLHKTFITVDERGTKAGAVTMVAAGDGASGPAESKIVDLDRPFVYAIIDNTTSLPIFIGTFLTVK